MISASPSCNSKIKRPSAENPAAIFEALSGQQMIRSDLVQGQRFEWIHVYR